jgi:hypothetical protein
MELNKKLWAVIDPDENNIVWEYESPLISSNYKDLDYIWKHKKDWALKHNNKWHYYTYEWMQKCTIQKVILKIIDEDLTKSK